MKDRSVIGTTDTRVDDPVSEVTDQDREFVLEQANRCLNLATPLTKNDIISERCGVRPLVVKGKKMFQRLNGQLFLESMKLKLTRKLKLLQSLVVN